MKLKKIKPTGTGYHWCDYDERLQIVEILEDYSGLYFNETDYDCDFEGLIEKTVRVDETEANFEKVEPPKTL